MKTANTTKIKNTIKWALMDFPSYVVKTFVTWSAIAGFLYYVAEPHIEPYLELPDKIESSNRRISALERTMRSIAPKNTVAEYDLVRSFVSDGSCNLGEWCTGEYRVRRLPGGVDCTVPDAQAFITNHGGVTRPVTEIEDTTVRVGAEWVNVPLKFKIPEGSLPGIGEFFYELSYSCPDGQKTESSAIIVFDISK